MNIVLFVLSKSDTIPFEIIYKIREKLKSKAKEVKEAVQEDCN